MVPLSLDLWRLLTPCDHLERLLILVPRAETETTGHAPAYAATHPNATFDLPLYSSECYPYMVLPQDPGESALYK